MHDARKQLHEAIKRAKHVLVAVRKEWDEDAIASALAIARLVRASGASADVACDGFTAPAALSFLPDLGTVQSSLRALQQFVVHVDTSRVGVETLAYDKKDTRLDIILTPKNGQFDARDVSTEALPFKYDLVITVGASDLAALGALHAAHPDLFFDRPVIAIDADPAHEQYGTINAVDLTATGCAETVHRLWSDTMPSPMDAETATCLLTGIIAKTRSFKDARVTPKTLEAASELIAAGARRADIVQRLYRTRPLATLKLWGRALARLKYDPAINMAWTLIVRQDFVHAGATEASLESVIEELISNSPEAEIIGVLYEQESTEQRGTVESICGLVSSERHADALGLVRDLAPEGSRRLARLCFPNTTLADAERSVIGSIYRSLGKQPPAAMPDALPGAVIAGEMAAARSDLARNANQPRA